MACLHADWREKLATQREMKGAKRQCFAEAAQAEQMPERQRAVLADGGGRLGLESGDLR